MNSEKQIVKERHWVLKSSNDKNDKLLIRKIASDLGINPIISELLYNRGYTDTVSAKNFLYMENEMLANPFEMMDMEKGILRIKSAIDNNEKITIYGDYDVDGVTSVCTLYLYLKSCGAEVDYYIPNRAGEGYGVSSTAIDALKEQGTRVIITVDTGITANEEVEYAKSVGVDFIITDHHECRSELPLATAVINPHRPDCQYPFKELAGVGVVFKLISAYEELVNGYTRMEAATRIFSRYADLVAIGTIADVMPIKSENRIIVSYGLKMMENTDRPGLMALMDASSSKSDSRKNDRKKKRSKITSGYIGYVIAPRINAAGRIRSATMAVELFLAEDYKKANEIAEELCKANKERQNEENKIMQEAYDKIAKLNIQDDPVIVLDADGWHHGVIGIVASRITEKYSRPTILVSFEVSGEPTPDDIGKGSGRSIKGLNLVDALCYCGDNLVKFGGHELAAGLSVTRASLPVFRAKINEYARNNLCEEDMHPTMEADCEITFSDLSLSFAEDLQILEPYGVGNPMPVFAMYKVNVNEISPISEGKHTKLVLGDGRNIFTAMYFSNSPDSLKIYNGDKVDLLFNVDINEWMGRRSVQLIVKDVRISESEEKKMSCDKARFDEIWNGAAFSYSENVFPEREDFGIVYRILCGAVRSGIDTLTHKDIISRLSRGVYDRDIGYIKLKIIIKVFQELNIVGIEEIENEVYRFHIHYTTSKSDLEKSSLLRRIRTQLRSK